MDTTIADARSLEKASMADRLLGGLNGEILDVGCGRGIVAAYLMERGRDVKGIDASEVAVAAARSLGVRASVHDLESAELEGRFAAALCLDVLQHSPHPLDLLQRISRAVRDNGVVIISLPNEFHILRRVGVLFGRHHFARYDGPHPRLFWKREAERLVGEAGLRLKRIVPVPLVPPRFRILRPLGKILARAIPSLMALGYILETEKPQDRQTA
jgi:2-polyprenyl-3-methyl-5-hydroxy-6-metoxy-1,4-benzoquinol methylase